MYANQRYVPRSSRSVSLGAALAINGLVLAGLVSFVPNVIGLKPTPPIKVIDIKDPPPPPPVEKKLPETDVKPQQQPEIYIPDQLVRLPEQPPISGTTILPSDPPQPGPPTLPPGPTTAPEPPAPLPPLLGAQQDPRYAGAFQPEYPAQELRMQRDGTVAVRVLIGTDGRVKAVEQVSATSTAFFEATKRQALSKWRFKPATRGGVPQESWKVMNVRFRLEDA